LPKSRKSPRRSKSRWEPLPEEKPVDHHPVSTSNDTVKYSSWVPPVNHHPVSTSNETVKYNSWVPNEKDRKVL